MTIDSGLENAILVHDNTSVQVAIAMGDYEQFTMHEARAHFTDLVNRASYGGERIAIMRRNKPLAVLVSIEDAELLEALEDEMDVAAAKKSIKEKNY